MVRILLVVGGGPSEHVAFNGLKWQGLNEGWLVSDGPCPWELFETDDGFQIYNQDPANSTILCLRLDEGIVLTNYPPFLSAYAQLIPDRRVLDSWIRGERPRKSGPQLDFLKGVARIPWGHKVFVSRRGWRVVHCTRTAYANVTRTKAMETLDRLLEHTVAEQLKRGKGSNALALSSGLDSMLVGSYLRRLKVELPAFTMDSRIPGTDERSETRKSAELLGLTLQGFSIDSAPVLPTPEDPWHPYWGPQVHPGERHENEFLRFVRKSGSSRIWMGAGADQICYVDPSAVLRTDLLKGDWRSRDVLKPDIGWRRLFQLERPRNQFETLEWDLAIRHRMRLYMRSGVQLIQPFLNPQIVEFVLSLPSSFLASTRYDKLILRELGRKVVPAFDSNRLKFTHFGPSIASRLSGELKRPLKILTPRVWREIAAEQWLRGFYEK